MRWTVVNEMNVRLRTEGKKLNVNIKVWTEENKTKH